MYRTAGKWMALLLILGLVLLLAACTQTSQIPRADTASEPESTEPPEPGPTGFPEGELQMFYVYYGGRLYEFRTSVAAEVPVNALPVGTVQSVDNRNLPDEEFEAAHYEVGQPIYAWEDQLYLPLEEELYDLLEPVPAN